MSATDKRACNWSQQTCNMKQHETTRSRLNKGRHYTFHQCAQGWKQQPSSFPFFGSKMALAQSGSRQCCVDAAPAPTALNKQHPVLHLQSNHLYLVRGHSKLLHAKSCSAISCGDIDIIQPTAAANQALLCGHAELQSALQNSPFLHRPPEAFEPLAHGHSGWPSAEVFHHQIPLQSPFQHRPLAANEPFRHDLCTQ